MRNPLSKLEGAGSNLLAVLEPTEVYRSYWNFAAARQSIFHKRVKGIQSPWTDDPILNRYRFTNAYRASDRVSQFLIRDVQYGQNRSAILRDVIFRTLLFKIFNKIDTWIHLESELGQIEWSNFDKRAAIEVLDDAMRRGRRVYSAAYIMPPVRGGGASKHSGHLELICRAIDDGLAEDISSAPTLKGVYERLRSLPSFGPFLAFQLTIDVNYTEHVNHSESDFVVAGPGAIDGISKCFANSAAASAEEIIELMCERQNEEFRRFDLSFEDLWERPLQPIDCQNLFCEISKYARVAHPNISGSSGRTRIKQSYSINHTPIQVWYPPKWGINQRLPLPLATPAVDLFDWNNR